MAVKSALGKLEDLRAEALIVPVYAEHELLGAAALADAALDGALSELAAQGGIPGKIGSATVVHTLGRLGCRRICLVGLGSQDELTLDKVRKATAAGWKRLADEGVKDIHCAVLGASGEALLEPVQAAETVIEGALLAAYRYDRYRGDRDLGQPVLTVYTPFGEQREALRRGIEVGRAKAEATTFARDLVNTPPSELPPVALAEAARGLAADHGLVCTVLGEDELRRLGFELMLAVNRGSGQEPALIVLEHRGGQGPAVGLVGKGVCFDSGGLSIKSADGMMTMKGDMGGAAAVLGAMKAIAELKVPLNVTGVIPAVQNLVDANSVMPGDIVTGVAGKSVEILNTDAEGRLILADALAYAERELQLSPIVDIATLTGACMRALGPIYGGVFGTHPGLVTRLRQVGLQSGEKFWEMPLDDEYGEMMKTPIADLKNISGDLSGGASCAAMFLRAFLGETPWAHLDIAGLSISDRDKAWQPKGATGFGARTLVNLCLSLAKTGLGQ